jgi:hypothetical protein
VSGVSDTASIAILRARQQALPDADVSIAGSDTVRYPTVRRWSVAVANPRPANVVPLRRSVFDALRDALETAGARFDQAVGELDTVLSHVVDDVDDTLRAARVAFGTALRAGKLAFEQERRRERVRGPVGLVAGYKPSKSR